MSRLSRDRFGSVLLVLGLSACGGEAGGPVVPPPPPPPSATPVAIAAQTGVAQEAVAGSPVPAPPSVKVTDGAGRGVAGVAVTFAITTGGGTITGGLQTTTSAGLATVGSWIPGALGENSLTASAPGLSGSPVTFTATARVPILTVESNGLTGYLTASANGGAPPPAYRHGFSFYSAVTTLDAQRSRGTQLGWGTWIMPDNRSFNAPLCPVGTYARDHWPERGPSYRDVYQTIEGGVGQWVSEMFPSSVPKFRINGTADCYSHQIASTGWGFGPELLPSSQLGLAQLSNRLLTAPDGIVLSGGSSPAVLGYGWMALPLIPAYTSPLGVPTGDQSWTLFLRAANFTGPVAFYTPAIWSAVNAQVVAGQGRSADVLPGLSGGPALEIGQTPMITSQDRSYRRIPRLTFADGGSGQAVLLEDIRYYSKQAIWDAVAAGVQSGAAPTGFDAGGVFTPVLSQAGAGLTLGGDPVRLDPSFGAKVFPTGSGSAAFGMSWGGSLEPGVFPEFFRNTGGGWTPVPAAEVPAETWLKDQTFPSAPRGSFPSLGTFPGSAWDQAKWSAGPFTTVLLDGSTVEYVWYRFRDQPAIARLGLSPDVLDRLQAFVEAWHAASGLAGLTFAPPGSGILVGLDPAQFVTPPTGMERGYVPIVIRQH